MTAPKDAPATEIVIIRRRGGGEDDHHHGGVWKIAYADFMTAMMAFFLVMWLINASNTETKASIASYFNPIKLTDSVSRRKGLLDIDEKANASGEAKKKGGGEKGRDKNADGPPGSASKATKRDDPSDRGHSKELNNGRSGAPRGSGGGSASEDSASQIGQVFPDPFNPMSAARRLFAETEQQQTNEPKPIPAVPPPASVEARVATQGDADKVLQAAHLAVKQSGTSGGPAVDVTIEGDAIVLSLTDTSTFGMFAIGSAEPNGELVKLMQRIAVLLQQMDGQLALRGHTDARPYRADARNNNWRLAMARAESVYAMLARAGIAEARFERIEGHADRKLKVATDPEAAANRRIDILLRKGRP